jgi:hypothetical protein
VGLRKEREFGYEYYVLRFLCPGQQPMIPFGREGEKRSQLMIEFEPSHLNWAMPEKGAIEALVSMFIIS